MRFGWQKTKTQVKKQNSSLSIFVFFPACQVRAVRIYKVIKLISSLLLSFPRQLLLASSSSQSAAPGLNTQPLRQLFVAWGSAEPHWHLASRRSRQKERQKECHNVPDNNMQVERQQIRQIKAKKDARDTSRAIWKSKSLKTEGAGALLEVEAAKICTTPARENDFEVKTVQNWEVRSTFGSSSRQNLHHACARARFGSQNRSNTGCSGRFWRFKVCFLWQAQGFRRSILIKIAKTYCNSEVKRLLNMQYFSEVSQNSFSQPVRQSVSKSVR